MPGMIAYSRWSTQETSSATGRKSKIPTAFFFFFLHHSGHRCRVDARPHHSKSCQVQIWQDGASQQHTISYEAIVFAKAAYQLHLNSTTNQKDGTPIIVGHRRYVDAFIKKLPTRWRKLVVHCDLHLYDENPQPASSPSAGLGIYRPLSRPGNIRLLKLMPAQDAWAPFGVHARRSTAPHEPGIRGAVIRLGQQVTRHSKVNPAQRDDIPRR